MDILSLFVVVPVITILVLVFAKGLKQARQVSMVGSLIQLGMAINLVFAYFKERAINEDIMVFTKDLVWFKQFNIHYNIGVDGISVALLLLTSIVVLAGVFISWKMKDLPKEFFVSLIVLSTGVYGFFISLDLFTMFVFFEIAVIPMYLLIGIWGSGPKEYSAMKLTLMLMGASAVLLVGILGIYFNSNADGGALTFNILKTVNTNENSIMYMKDDIKDIKVDTENCKSNLSKLTINSAIQRTNINHLESSCEGIRSKI